VAEKRPYGAGGVVGGYPVENVTYRVAFSKDQATAVIHIYFSAYRN
jgi:hypothetical protein